MKKQFTLSKTERLKSRKRIEAMFRQGQAFSVTPFKVYYSFSNDDEPMLQAGFAASSKTFKKATDRNRIKRLTKEGYRLEKIPLEQRLNEQQSKLSVFLIYTGRELPEFKQVSAKMQVIIQRLISIINEKAALHS